MLKNIHFQIIMHHHILSNKRNNVSPPVLLFYNDTLGVVLDEEQPYISIVNQTKSIKSRLILGQ